MTSKNQYRIACVIGTRPEAIKMAPVIFAFKKQPWAQVVLINTAQHRELLDDILEVFSLKPDIDLDVMRIDQSLGSLTGTLCLQMEHLFKRNSFDVVLAAGDTSTVLVASLLAFYHKIPFGHIEAGLRSFDLHLPFPEEMNRVLTAPLATWHFAPTEVEKDNLLKENISDKTIYVTGNPVIDALHWVIENKKENECFRLMENIVVVTVHRRENIGDNLRAICQALLELSKRFTHLQFVLPIHPNPRVQSEIKSLLQHQKGIHLSMPLTYDHFVHLMNRAMLIMTDSGGIQEEAPALKKPVIILRDVTERNAVVEQELGLLVGTKTKDIVEAVTLLLNDKNLYAKMSRGASPYGDGHTAERIVAVIKKHLT